MESMELIYYVRQPCVKIDVLDIVVHFNNVLILAFIDEVNQWLYLASEVHFIILFIV